MRIFIIINPRAGAGSAGRQLPALRRALDSARIDHEVLETSRRGDATRLALQARESGATHIAVVGGDGTLSEVSQAYIDDQGQAVAGPPLALISAGTGGDFARLIAAGRRDDLGRTVQRFVAGHTRALDLGVLTLHDREGAPLHRAFINVASVGISSDIDERVERGPKWLGGKAAFYLATLTATVGYRNVPVELRLDGKAWYSGPTYVTAIANGQFFGGGMQIAPGAEPDDGWLDVVCLGDLSRSAAVSLSAKIYDGAHLGTPGIQNSRARHVEVHALSPSDRVLVDVDGETPGYLPLSARLIPGAWQILVDAPAGATTRASTAG
jgi:YegS/Rv2252/BmrU family lipid kinase